MHSNEHKLQSGCSNGPLYSAGQNENRGPGHGAQRRGLGAALLKGALCA